MKIIIPMAGKGTRFKEKGYTFPKPLIEIAGKPMVQYALEAFREFPEDTEYIFVVLKEDILCFNIDKFLTQLMKEKKYQIIAREGISDGAAITVKEALEKLNLQNSDEEIIVANCDQKIIWDEKAFLNMKKGNHVILTFESIHPKWSFAEVKEGRVVRVAEKIPISNIATVGMYHFQKIKDLYWGINQMIKKNSTVNGEFYVCPTYNELIARGDNVIVFPVDKMYGLGLPEDVEAFERVMRVR